MLNCGIACTEEDQGSLREHLERALQENADLTVYCRVKCKQHFADRPGFSQQPKDILMELTGRAHYMPDDPQPKLFFVVAKSYPSRSVSTYVVDPPLIPRRLGELTWLMSTG